MADVQAAPSSVHEEVSSSAPPAGENGVPKDEAPASGDGPIGADANGELKSPDDDISNSGAQQSTDATLDDHKGKATTEVADAAPSADGTTAASKSKRKSSGGVPEHKSKKLNKKKSMVTLNLDLEAGDMVWARLKGHPPWPSIVCDEQMLPESLLGSRPVSTKRPDGTYREDFLEGGKSAKDRTYPVMFFATNEFAWMPNTSLTRLQASEVDPETEKKLQPSLRNAYKIASEGHDLDYFKELLRQHEAEVKEMAEIEQRKAAEAAEKAERKAEKERRKSKAAEDDAMDVDTEKPSKKRKKEAISDGEGPKTKKTPKVKLSTKEPKAEPGKKSKAKKKAQEAVEKEIPESVRLDRREQATLYLRHRLQKGFLSSTAPPKDEDMPSMADYFKQLEQHKDLEPQIIRNTKIHKVLKNILRLPSVPRDEEFNFKRRSQEMLDHWNEALSAPANGKADEPGANGEIKAEEERKEETNGTGETVKTDNQAAAEQAAEAANGGNDAGEDADVSMVDSSIVEPKKDESGETVRDEEETATTEAGAEKQEEATEGAEKTETAEAPAPAEAVAV